MKPSAFEYKSPATLSEAVSLLAAGNGNAKLIAGGQSLMPMLAFRLAAPELFVDLKRIRDLNAITITEDGIALGAKVRWCDIAGDQRLATAHPLLAEAIRHVAHYQIRNRGTVGGSMAHADPSAEMPGIALTCDARLKIIGAGGRRVEKAADFFQGLLQTSLAPDEILTVVRLPTWPAARRWAFREFARRKGDFAMAGIALFYDLDERTLRANVHIGAIGVADRPIRLGVAETTLNGKPINENSMPQRLPLRVRNRPAFGHPCAGRLSPRLLGTLLERGLHQSIGSNR